jgi:hypothetical protein
MIQSLGVERWALSVEPFSIAVFNAERPTSNFQRSIQKFR